jgi:hypothetical protein
VASLEKYPLPQLVMVNSRFPVSICKEKKKKIVPYIVNIDEMKKLMPIVQKSMCLLNSLDLFISFCK